MSAESETVDAGEDGFRRRLIGISSLLAVANVGAWIWALTVFAGQPVLICMAVLAYSLGLRHALDADHIAAIDNITRKLMQERQRPVAVGFFFALGHSAVVLVASLAVAIAANSLLDRFADYRELGGIIGTLASALFLFAVAIANLVVLRGIYGALQRFRRGEQIRDEDVDALLQQRGWLAQLFRPLFKLIAGSWQLFPIGFLFALGFETASEVSLFGVSTEASRLVSNWAILVFPALFAAGMTLIDTLDGVLMLGAYGWAYRNPVRKLFYNVTITTISVLVALVIGGVETLGLFAGHLGFEGRIWGRISGLSANFGALGYGIVGLFAVSWIVSLPIYHANGFARRDERV